MPNTASSNQNDYNSLKKVKAIPMKRATITVETPQNLKNLLKKGTKVKNLSLIKGYAALCQFRVIPEPFSRAKRLTRFCCKFLGSLSLESVRQRDFGSLMKIQRNIKYIQKLQIDGTLIRTLAVQKALQKFLMRSKFLSSYENSLREGYQGSSDDEDEDEIHFAFDLKKNSSEKQQQQQQQQQKKYNRSQRMMYALSKWLRPLACVSSSQESKITLKIVFPPNHRSKEFDRDIRKINKNLKRVRFLDSVEIPSDLMSIFDHFLPLLRVKELTVQTDLDLNYLMEEENQKSLLGFLSRKNAKLIVWPSNSSWQNLMEMLNLSRLVRIDYNSCFSFANCSFDFHSPEEIRTALISHFSSMTNMECSQFNFLFETHPLDWFNEGKKDCLREMMDEMFKEENKTKCRNINFEVKFTDDFSKELLEKIVIQITSAIIYFLKQTEIRNEKELRKFSLNIIAEVKDYRSLFSFLVLAQEIPKNTLDTLNFNLNSQVLDNIDKDLRYLRRYRGEDRLSRVRGLIRMTKEEIEASEKIQQILLQLNDEECFRSFDFPQFKEFCDLHERLIFYQ